MGKKANAKKKRRELKEKKEKEEKKSLFKKLFKNKSKKETKKRTKKPKEKKEKKLKLNKKKIFGGVFALIMLAILISVGYLLFKRAFRPEPIARFLPEKNTIAFIEINSNFNHNQLTKTFDLLQNHPDYSKEKMIRFIEEKFKVSFDAEIKSWIGREVGIAVINSPKREGIVETIYFAETYSKNNAREFIKSKSSESRYLGYDIFISTNGQAFAFIDDYLFMGYNDKIIKELIDFQESSKPDLYSSREYSKINDNLPLNKVAFLYLNLNHVNDEVFKAFPFLSEKGLSSENINPFINIFKAEGMALVAMDNKFAIQSFTSIDPEILKESEFISFKEKYTADLTGYITEDALAFWGGVNLDFQIKRIIEILAGGDSNTLEIFEAFLQNNTLKYFGPEINFKKDILSLFQNEFALALEPKEDQIVYKLLIELEDPKTQAVKLHEIADNFAEISAVFEPKVVEHTLEDGTVTQEIVASPEVIIRKESMYDETTIYEMQMGKQNWGIYYAVIGDIAVISTDIEGVKNAVDSKNSKIISLKTSKKYNDLIKPILHSSDEIAYFNTGGLLPPLFEAEEIPVFLKPVSCFSTGKNYFNDGIITINYLRIK
ncbi:DUF3352 domain-containing protein [Candidatus Peregrinibacteria bacterium]|nr:DUF3352 domain-containing protein [Candidatus Peregrinibacteria bacterium]